MGLRRSFDSADRFILEHTKVSWLIWVLFVGVLTPAFASFPEIHKPSRFGVLSWVTVYLIVSQPLLIRAFAGAANKTDRSVPLTAFTWLIAQLPFVCAGVALVDRAPQWLSAIAFFEAIGLMWFGVRAGRIRQAKSSS